MGLSEVDEAIRDDLRTNITDPLGRDTEWIHLDSLDRLATVGKTPAIFIERAPGTIYYRSLGTGATGKFLKYQIHVVVRNTDRGRISNEDITSSTKMMSKLVGLILDRLETVSVSISPTNIGMLQELESGGFFDYSDIIKVNTMEYEVQMA
jgi:hypothetical protein